MRIGIQTSLCLALCAGCTPTPDSGDQQDSDSIIDAFYPPNAVGPYKTGVKTLVFTDPRGKEIKMAVWYPATPAPGDSPSPYPEIPITFDAYRDAPPDTRGAPYPLLAFSHGLGGVRYQSAFLTEFLASQGFVVVAPDHTGSVLLSIDTKNLAKNFLERPDDVRYTVDHAIELSEQADSTLGGMIDGAHYGMIGHSFGSLTTLVLGGAVPDVNGIIELCADQPDKAVCKYLNDADTDTLQAHYGTVDDRIVATVPMGTGGAYAFSPDGSGLAHVVNPMMLGGDVDDILPYDDEQVPVWEKLGAPKAFGTLHNAGHYAAFSDLCHLFGAQFEDCGGDAAGYLDSAKGQEIVRVLVTSYMKVHVAGDARYEAWLEADKLAVYDALDLQRSE